MAVVTDVVLLIEEPESGGEWVAYPNAVACKAGAGIRCRLRYACKADEPGLFQQMTCDLLFADEWECISHCMPVGLPGGMEYTINRCKEGYTLHFVLGDTPAVRESGTLEFMLESAPVGIQGGITIPSAVTIAGVFRGDDRDEVISTEQPGPIWVILPGQLMKGEEVSQIVQTEPSLPAERDACPPGCPMRLKLSPPGDFWICQEEKPLETPTPPQKKYKTIAVTPPYKPKRFYW